MKHRTFLIALLFIVFFSCNNVTNKEPATNPNECTQYSCPMHPDHTSAVPAKCLKCNMDMEKRTNKLSHGDSAKISPDVKN